MKIIKKNYVKTIATNDKVESLITVERQFTVEGDSEIYSEHYTVPYVNDPSTNIVTITATMEAIDDIMILINRS